MRSQQHYDLALNHEYPFDDSASLLDDNGQRLPEGLLCELSCLIDRQLANQIFCSAVSKRGRFCSIVFSAASETRQTVGLLNFNLDQQVTEFRQGVSPQLTIQPVVSQFRGVAVLGEQWDQIPDGIWKFSDAAQSLVAARCCYPIEFPGQQTFAVMHAVQKLAQLVTLRAEGDLRVQLAERPLGATNRRAVVISLRQSSNELLGQYAGQYQQRPESRTCGDPAPVETLNGVSPDCCNRVYIELRGCAQPIPIANHCGVVLDCPLSLDEICPPKPTYGEQDNPDECLEQGAGDPINGPEQQPGFPQIPTR